MAKNHLKLVCRPSDAAIRYILVGRRGRLEVEFETQIFIESILTYSVYLIMFRISNAIICYILVGRTDLF